jgi:hypothetical protein
VAVELDRPGSVDDLYLDRGDPIEPWRPVMTGDVFDGPAIPGCAAHDFVLVLSHPCSLRADGVELVERLQALPVALADEIPLAAWKGNFRVMPLPLLWRDDRHYVVRLTEFGMLDAADLDLDRRICALTEIGVTLLQQRFFHNQSRVKVELDRIHAQASPVFAEVELWTQWNEELAESRVVAGEDRRAVLTAEGHAFDEVMRGDFDPGMSLRAALKERHLQADVRRRVLSTIEERRAQSQ